MATQEPHPVTLVTGAAGAVGPTVVDELLRGGHHVLAIDLPTQLPALEDLLRAHGERLLERPVPTDASGWRALLDESGAELGQLTGAVLLAGGWRGGGPLGSEPERELAMVLEGNLLSAHAAMRAVIPELVANGGGSIVVVGSRVIERPWEATGSAAYAAAKSALVTLARAAAAENLEAGVRINAVLPSTIDTAPNRAAMPEADFARWIDPRRLARVIAFLSSDDARDITGAALPVYGRL